MAINTNLLLQYLSGAGSAIAQGQSAAPVLNEITQQQIASQSYMGLLQKILGGGGKMTMDKDKFSLSGPTGILNPQDVPKVPGDQMVTGGGAPRGNPLPAQYNVSPNTEGNSLNNLDFLKVLLNPQLAL